MFAFRVRPRTRARRVVFASFIAGAAASGAGGCATTNDYASRAATPAYVAQGPAVQMESDGIPVQAAPPLRIRQLPDDPSQPFSPNYGGSNPAGVITSQPSVRASNDEPQGKPVIPGDLPPAFRTQLLAAVNAAG